MKALRYITLPLVVLLLTLTGSAQSRAYTKFDSKGETVGLFNLSDGEATCDEKEVLSGIVRKARSKVRGADIRFSFTLETGGRRRVTVFFTLKRDAIPKADIENLLVNKRCFLVTVQACRDGDRWIAESVTRT
jgi:hypothetical protein